MSLQITALVFALLCVVVMAGYYYSYIKSTKILGQSNSVNTWTMNKESTTIGSTASEPASLKMNVEAENESRQGASTGTVTATEAGFGSSLVQDLGIIVSLCTLFCILFAVGISYRYGFTFQQMQEHPQFKKVALSLLLGSLLVIVGYMHMQGHLEWTNFQLPLGDMGNSFFVDCCTIVSLCTLLIVLIYTGISYRYGLTFSQMRQHPQFVKGVLFMAAVCILIVASYLYVLGHVTPDFQVPSLQLEMESSLLMDLLTIVSTCVMAIVLVGMAISYRYGLTLTQMRQHPSFIKLALAAVAASLVTILGYIYVLGHFSWSGLQVSIREIDLGGAFPAMLGSDKESQAQDKMSITEHRTKISSKGEAAVITGGAGSESPDDGDYPLRATETVKRVCPPDPCPLAGGAAGEGQYAGGEYEGGGEEYGREFRDKESFEAGTAGATAGMGPSAEAPSTGPSAEGEGFAPGTTPSTAPSAGGVPYDKTPSGAPSAAGGAPTGTMPSEAAGGEPYGATPEESPPAEEGVPPGTTPSRPPSAAGGVPPGTIPSEAPSGATPSGAPSAAGGVPYEATPSEAAGAGTEAGAVPPGEAPEGTPAVGTEAGMLPPGAAPSEAPSAAGGVPYEPTPSEETGAGIEAGAVPPGEAPEEAPSAGIRTEAGAIPLEETPETGGEAGALPPGETPSAAPSAERPSAAGQAAQGMGPSTAAAPTSGPSAAGDFAPTGPGEEDAVPGTAQGEAETFEGPPGEEGEPVVISPEESVAEGEEWEEGGPQPPFDEHTAAAVPVGTWIDDEDKEWVVQERMKKVVDITDKTSDIPLTSEELECLNRIRSMSGKPAVTARKPEDEPGMVTAIQDTLYPYFQSAGTKPPVSEGEKEALLCPYEHPGEHGQEEPSFLEGITPSMLEEIPWYCNPMWLLPAIILLLILFAIWAFTRFASWSELFNWLKSWIFAIWEWIKRLWFALVDFLQTTPGIIFLIASIIISLVILYYLCQATSEEEEAFYETTEASTEPAQGSATVIGDMTSKLPDIGSKSKEWFKITYEEDISEEMWLQYKERQQSLYVSGDAHGGTSV